MTTRTYIKTDSKGREETWEWEETPESKAAIAKLHLSTIQRLEKEAPDYGVGK